MPPYKIKRKGYRCSEFKLLSWSERVFTEHDLRLLSIFSRYISIAIEHTQLF